MALKKYKEIVSLSDEILDRDMHAATVELHRLKLEHKVKGLQNPAHIRHLRRELAKMQTEKTKRNQQNPK